MKLILTIFGVQTVFRKHYCLAFLFPTELWLSCVRYRKGALNMWRLSLLNYLVLMKGARWRALGTQAIFLSAKLPQNKKWQIYQAPVTGSSCDCLSPGLELVTLKGTGLLCHPSLQLWVLLLERAMKVTQCVRQGRYSALPQLPGLLFTHPSQVLLAGGFELVP